MTKLKAFRNFLRATKSEMKKVRWPNKKEMVKNTVTVLLFVTFFSLFFAGIDWVITESISLFF